MDWFPWNKKTTTTKDNLFDKTIKFLQDLFKSHRKELTALQNSTEAQELMIKLLKITNEEKSRDSNEVEFKSLCDLTSIQTWQVRCAVNGFEKLNSWFCNAIETSKTNLSSAWMPGEQLKRTNDPTQTTSTTTSTKIVKETIDAIQREIAEMNEKYKHNRLEQNQPKTDDRQNDDNNENDQVLKDNVDKLKETNLQLLTYLTQYKEDVEKRLDIYENLKQQIDEWTKTIEKVQSVGSLNQQLDVSQLCDKSPPLSTDNNYENKTRASDTTKAENDKSPAPSTDTNENKKPESDEAKAESRMTIEQTKSTIENNLYEKIAGHLQDLFGAHHNDVRLMLTTINALKIMTGLQKARKANCNKYVDEHTNTDDFSTLKDMMSIHACLLECAENMFLTTKGLFSDATDVPKTPAAQDENISTIQPVDSKSRTPDGEYIKNMKDTVMRVLHTVIPEGNDQKGLISNDGVEGLRKNLKTLLRFIKSYKEGKKKLEQRESNLEHELKVEIEKSENERREGKKQIVTLQLYHSRQDDVMTKVLNELDNKIKKILHSKKCIINIEHCNTPDQLNPDMPVLVLCINTSRLTPDVEAAMKGMSIKDPRYAALIVFYHIDVNVTPLRKGSIDGNVSSNFDSTHHMAFLYSKGIYECEENTDALNGIVSFFIKLKKHSIGMA